MAGAVLYSILYWKPGRSFGGHWWIAKPREAADAGGKRLDSLEQVKDATSSRLRARRLGQ